MGHFFSIPLLAVLAFAATTFGCAAVHKPDPAKPAVLAVRAHGDVHGAGVLTVDLVIAGQPGRVLTVSGNAEGAVDLDTDREPPVITTGAWAVTRDSARPAMAALPLPGCQGPSGQDGICAANGGPCSPPTAPRAPCAPPQAPRAAPCLPAAPPCVSAAPPKADVDPISGRPCGTPAYVGCDGTPGGHRPEPYGDLIPRIAPGSGWPCNGKPLPGVAEGTCPTGIAAIVQGILDLFIARG